MNELERLISTTDPFVIKRIILKHCLGKFKFRAEEPVYYATDESSQKYLFWLRDIITKLEEILQRAKNARLPEVDDIFDEGLKLVKYSEEQEDLVPIWED